jgi:hypothetical protein
MLEAFKRHYRASVPRTETEKPGTLVQVAYVSEDGAQVDIIRLFPSPEEMDLQLRGADERSKAAYQYIEPTSIEIYGSPSSYALEMMAKVAGLGIDVRVYRRFLGGFMRLVPGG